MATIESVDVLEVAVGQRGKGKSTTLADGAYELASTCPCFVVGHSLGARLPDRLPDGTVLPIEYHRDIERAQRGLAMRPSQWHIVCSGDADAVILWGREIALANRRRAWREAGNVGEFGPERKMSGIEAPVTIIIVDEGIAVEAADGRAQGKAEHKWFREFIFSLRHEHIAMFYAIQNAAARSWLLMEQASRIHVHGIRHRWAQEMLRASGATDEQVESMPTLEIGEHFTIE